MIKKIRFVCSLIWEQAVYSFQQWRERRGSFILCRLEGSSVFPSKKLFETIQKDHPDDKEYYVLFSKFKNMNRYIFFVNPDWKKHGVDNPKMYMTQQMVLHQGKVGFHTYQPTVHEIFTIYGIRAGEATLKVTRHELNGEPYYLIEKP